MTPPPRKEYKVLCECLGITKAAVAEAIQNREFHTVRQVAACTGAGGGCTVCHPAIRELLARAAHAKAAAGAPTPSGCLDAAPRLSPR